MSPATGKLLAERVPLDQLEGRLDVGQVVERHGRVVLRVPLAVGPGRVLLLELGRVGEQNLDQVGRGGGAVDPTAEAALDEQRQVTGVVDVGVAEDDRRDSRGANSGLSQLRRRSSLSPWNSPQSSRTCCPRCRTRCLDPVTVPAAPRN